MTAIPTSTTSSGYVQRLKRALSTNSDGTPVHIQLSKPTIEANWIRCEVSGSGADELSA
jgi:hypothetical protein